jgi:hypothetical protein
MCGLTALDYEYDKNKPIDFNETDYYPGWYQGDRIAASRVEAWEFIAGGGGSFNQLNGLYTVRETFNHQGGMRPIETPVHQVDIALRIRRR